MSNPRILVAGIGNIFLRDDAFGCEVVRQLAGRAMPDGVRVADYGIRGFDLAYALMEDYDAFILVDALPRGGPAGTLYKLQVEASDLPRPDQLDIQPHGMNPVTVLSMVRAMGGSPASVYVIGCEPAPLDELEERMGLSEPVQAALDGAVVMVESLLSDLITEKGTVHEQCLEDHSGRGRSGDSCRPVA